MYDFLILLGGKLTFFFAQKSTLLKNNMIGEISKKMDSVLAKK